MMCRVSCVMCHVSWVMCRGSCVVGHVSWVMCHVSWVMCHVSCGTISHFLFELDEGRLGLEAQLQIELEHGIVFLVVCFQNRCPISLGEADGPDFYGRCHSPPPVGAEHPGQACK